VWTLKHGHLHHLTYQRIGAEDDTDLLPLCAAHHARLHELLVKPRWRRLGRAAASQQIVTRMASRNSDPDGGSASAAQLAAAGAIRSSPKQATQ
jgi:hypothetical protein